MITPHIEGLRGGKGFATPLEMGEKTMAVVVPATSTSNAVEKTGAILWSEDMLIVTVLHHGDRVTLKLAGRLVGAWAEALTSGGWPVPPWRSTFRI
jgi:hypothetical protein